MKKPIIGMTTYLKESPRLNHSISIPSNYTNSVRRGGGIPMMFAPPCVELSDKEIAESVEEYLSVVNGVVIIGGPDLSPSLYNHKKLPTCGSMSKFRENFEQHLAKECLRKGVPVLGICLGCQVLNVAAGGSLYQDISFNFPEWRIRHGKQLEGYFLPHNVKIEKDSLLYSIVGVEILETNSAHHQCVLEPGEGFRIVARAEDGIVEAIEKTDGSFALGVQWHPEYLTKTSEKHLALFQALVKAAQKKI